MNDFVSNKFTVVGIESLDQRHIGEGGLGEKYGWLKILVSALGELPKGYQGKPANEAMAGALTAMGVRLEKEVLAAAEWAGHRVDFLVEFNDDTIGVELGTGQAERLELDFLKLMSLALRQKIDYACLILPRNVSRPRVFGKQDMPTAVRGLAQLCSPVLTMMQAQLKDTLVIWYM